MGAVGYGGRSMRLLGGLLAEVNGVFWTSWDRTVELGWRSTHPLNFGAESQMFPFPRIPLWRAVGVCGNRGLLVRPMEGGRREAGWESQWQRQWRTPSPRAPAAPQLYRHPCSKSTSSRDDPPAQVPSLTQAVAQSDTIGTDHCRWPHHLKPICAFHPHKEPKIWPKTSAEGINKVWCKLRYKLSATKCYQVKTEKDITVGTYQHLSGVTGDWRSISIATKR